MKIILVDDCEDSQFLLQILIQSIAKVPVIACRSGNHAIEVLGKEDNIGLLFSDLNMSDGNGDEIYRHIRQNNLNIPFILMTAEKNVTAPEFGEQFESEFPGNFRVPKPVSKDALKDVIDKNINLIEAAAAAPQMYYPMKSSFVFSSDKLNVSVYLKLSEDKYVKLMEKGHQITNEDIRKYEEKKIDVFYIEEKDLAEFSDPFFLKILEETGNKESFFELVDTNTYEVLKDNILSMGVGPQVLKVTEKLVEKTVSDLNEHPEIASVLTRVSKSGGYLYSHSMQISFLAPILLKELNLFNDTDSEALIFASLYHDLCLVQDSSAENLDLGKLDWSKLNDKTINAIKNHPHKSAEQVEGAGDHFAVSMQIMEEHEEKFDGSGYPKGLTQDQLHPLSKIFIFLHAFARNFKRFAENENASEMALSTLETENDSPDWKKYFEALKIVLNQT